MLHLRIMLFRKFLFSLTLFLSVLGSQAQEMPTLDSFNFGISVGSGANLIRTKGAFALFDPQLAFGVGLVTAGVHASAKIQDQLFIRPEARLNIRTLQGKLGLLVENEGELSIQFFKSKLRDVWFEVPLLAEVKIDENISAYGGIQGSVLIASRADLSEDIPDFYKLQGGAASNRNNFEFGYIIGGTIQTDAGVGIGGRLVRTLSNVFNRDFYGDYKTRYTMLQLLVSFEI